jgi:hypothetical protein
MQYWLTEIANPSVRETTFSSYVLLVRLYVVPGLGKRRLRALQAQQHKVLRDIPYVTVRVNPGQYTGVCIRKVASGATRVRRWRTVDVGRPAGESDRPEPGPPADDHHVLPSYPLIWAGLLFSRRNLCLRVFGNPVRVSKTYSALRDTETAWTEAAEDVAQTYDRLGGCWP